MWVNAHATPRNVNPLITAGLSYTFALSSKLTKSKDRVWPKTAHTIAARRMQIPKAAQLPGGAGFAGAGGVAACHWGDSLFDLLLMGFSHHIAKAFYRR